MEALSLERVAGCYPTRELSATREYSPWLQPEPGRRRVLRVEDWAEIRRLHRAEGVPIKAIARLLRVSKNTVKAALASSGPPSRDRASHRT